MKNVMKRLAVCGLCVSMLAGCGKNVDTSKHASENKNIGVEGTAGKSEEDDSDSNLQSQYDAQEECEYTEPMYNLENDHTFVYEIGEDFYDTEAYDAFKVYSDSDLENVVNVTIEEDTDTDTVTISPNLVFSYDEPEGSSVNDGTWGTRSKFWLVQYADTKTGEKLQKPIVTVFSIAQEMNTPTLKQSVGNDGYYKLSWSEVAGADYYEVYEYDYEIDSAELVVTTQNLECSDADFSAEQDHAQDFQEKYEDTEVDTDSQWLMNHYVDSNYEFFVVAKSEDGKHSGMSNECAPKEIMNQIPVTVSWDFQSEYTGSDVLALPAYVDMEMLDGSIGKYLIEYHGANITLLDDGVIVIQPGIKNLPVDMQQITLSGMDYDAFMAQADKLTQRGDGLAAKTGTTSEDINIPFVPNSQEPSDNGENKNGIDNEDDADVEEDEDVDIKDNKDDKDVDVKDNKDDKDVDVEDNKEDKDVDVKDDKDDKDVDTEDNKEDKEDNTDKKVTTGGIELPENVAETVYANSSLSEWIAENLLAHNEQISLDGFNEASDTERLEDALLEAYKQNPLCGTLSTIEYDYGSNSILVSYVQSKEEVESMQQESLKKAAEVAQSIIKEDMSDYEKEAAINQYFCDNASYNDEIMTYINQDGTISQEAVEKFESSFTPYGVLVENLGVCESYAEAFQLVAREAGLKAIIVTGTLDGTNHEWNRVFLDDKWYTLDVTNNDNETIQNALFNLSDEVASTVLKQDDVAILNNCLTNYTADDMKNEYYTINGLYTEDAASAAELLAKGLKESGRAAIRMDSSFGNTSAEEIIQNAVNDAQVNGVMYYSFANVISIVEQ